MEKKYKYEHTCECGNWYLTASKKIKCSCGKVLTNSPVLQADITYYSHPYATCPYCGEEEEVADNDCTSECSFCHKEFKYSLEI